MSLVHAGEDRREEKDTTLAAVKNAGTAIQYTSIELQKDKDVMLTAVRNDGLALEYIIEHLEDLVDDDDSQDTREMYLEIVITALKNNGKALQFIDIQSESYQRRYLDFTYIGSCILILHHPNVHYVYYILLFPRCTH